MSDAELERLYTESYRDDCITERYVKAKFENSCELISFLRTAVPEPTGLALEIGSSEGAFLKILRDEYGWKVHGCEPYGPYATYGINTWQIPTTIGFFRSSDFEHCEKFDLVVLVHVLEHLPDPNSFLREVSKVMKPGGLFLIETPDLFRPYPNRIRYAMFPAPHLAIYSPRSIERLLSRRGFRVLKIDEDHNLRVLARFDGRVRSEPKARIPEIISIVSTFKRKALSERIYEAVLRGSKTGATYANRLFKADTYDRLRYVWRLLSRPK